MTFNAAKGIEDSAAFSAREVEQQQRKETSIPLQNAKLSQRAF